MTFSAMPSSQGLFLVLPRPYLAKPFFSSLHNIRITM